MVPNWQSWCRLCARESSANLDMNIIQLKDNLDSTYLDAINKHFSIDVNLGNWPQTICSRCHQYVSDFINFVHRTSKVQTMFAELFNNTEELNLKQLRAKYEVDEFVELEIKERKPNIGDFEFIAEDVLNTTQIKTEQMDEGVSNVSEKEDDDDDDNEKEEEDSDQMQQTRKQERLRRKPNSLPKKKRKKTCDNNELPTQIEPVEQKLITCPYCYKEFKQNELIDHIRQNHVGEKPFVCDGCGKTYTTFGNLTQHKLTHSEERPFVCGYCKKSFKTKRRLKIHEDTHNETNYICTSCGLQLNTQRTLKMHMLVHSDQKRHKCDFCGNEYKRAKALKSHLILHTGLKPYTCNFCDKTFANASNCRSHKKKTHPIQLAAMEASGTKPVNANIPKLETLRAVTSNKLILNGDMELLRVLQ